jgi:hypothetical protein
MSLASNEEFENRPKEFSYSELWRKGARYPAYVHFAALERIKTDSGGVPHEKLADSHETRKFTSCCFQKCT